MPKRNLPYSLPVLEIVSSVNTLEKDNVVYARAIKAKNINNQSFTIRERSGNEVEQYIGKPLECVVEIVKARFFDSKDEKNKPPVDAIQGTFVGYETGYKFFSELVTILDGETEEDSEDTDDFDEDEYENLAIKLFSGWGVCGFGLDIYRDKPMIKTDDGTFFLNEFIFEDLTNRWEEKMLPEVPVSFVIEELLLHGIKPYEGKWEKHKIKHKYGVELEKGKSYVIGTPRFLEDR